MGYSKHKRQSSYVREVFLSLAAILCACAKGDFEPYQLNGGLVAAVAGRDFCVIASDTRFMDGGYQVYTRNHLASRLWMATTTTPSSTPDGIIHTDGSLKIPTETSTVEIKSSPPVWIASAGCGADCEALKRRIRTEVGASSFWRSHLKVNEVANLLSQTLYARRIFPFYSFCVVAGLGEQQGQVYGYDAIGSYEQLAVASTGTGRELLQPILDRLFGAFGASDEDETEAVIEETKGSLAVRSPVAKTWVDCTADQAVSILIRAYRSVSEREIGVGDKVVLCITQRNSENKSVSIRVLSAPLKQH